MARSAFVTRTGHQRALEFGSLRNHLDLPAVDLI
jgi:hypothetical protein